MSTKFLAVLAPIGVVAGLATMPAVSQAAPHYYRNGVLIPEGVKVPTLEWGTLGIEPAPQLGIPTPCANVAGGFVENPMGGEAGQHVERDRVAHGLPRGQLAGWQHAIGLVDAVDFQVVDLVEDVRRRVEDGRHQRSDGDPQSHPGDEHGGPLRRSRSGAWLIPPS